MWFIPPRSRATLMIELHNEHLVLSTLDIKNFANKEYALNAFYKISLDSMQFYNGVIYNQIFLKNEILHFIAKHSLENASVYFIVNESAVNEKIVFSTNANPTLSDLNLGNQNANQSNYFYLYSHENSFAFYVCSISKALIFQYQLFASALKLNLTNIAIENVALLKLYSAIKGSAFRQTQLANDLALHNNKFSKIIDYQSIRSIVHIKQNLSIDLMTESSHLASHLGTLILHNE